LVIGHFRVWPVTFLNLSLLAGLGLIAVPIVLHLIMRRQPKQFEFPALRFVKRRQFANTQRLQLRHWLLLALRCAALAMAAFALARPSVASAAVGSWLVAGGLAIAALFVVVLWLVALTRDLSRLWAIGLISLAGLLLMGSGVFAFAAWRGGNGVLIGDAEAPVAAAIIVDTAPRMQYRHDNHTRLEVAQETADWLMQQLPAESEVAVIDTASSQNAFAVDLAAAAKSARRLQIGSLARPLPEVLDRANTLLKQSEKQRREIYVLTDLTSSAWSVEQAQAWSQRWADSAKDVTVYVIDVGIDDVKNAGLAELRLSGEALPRGAELTIETSVNSRGLAEPRTLEVSFDVPDPTLPVINNDKLVLPKTIVRGNETVQLESGQAAPARFKLPVMPPGVHHGRVRILGEDGLPLDDIRYFTVEIEEPRPVLIAAGPNSNARDFAEAIAPEALRDRGETRFTGDVIAQTDLATVELNKYEAVCILDPEPLSPDIWNRLNNYVRSGKGLAIFLGPHAEPIDSFNEPAVREILGGRLGGRLKQPARMAAGEGFLAPSSLNHPIFALYRGMSTSVPWDRFPVYYYWPLDQLAGDTRVVAAYSDRKPAIAETSLGSGRVLLFTTPAAEPPQRPGQGQSWNELWSGEDAWPWFVLINESLRYVARLGEGRLNYLAGETVVLQNDEQRHPASYQAFTPNGEVQTIAARDDMVTIRFNDRPGTYRLRGNADGPVVRGFSSNLPTSATDLARLPAPELDALLRKDRYQLARNREEIHRVVGQQRVGQEMYPYVVLLLAAALALEQVLANRFYRGEREDAGEAGPSWLPRSWVERLGWKGT
jgi:hypothetical protein